MSSTSINNIISLTKSKNKCKNEQMFETIMPTVHNYNSMLSNKYSIKELKHICKYYKIKTSGNKSELTSRIYDYLHKKNSAIKIQRYWRKYLSLHYDKTHGPARKNRKLCVNETDFYSMEPLESISFPIIFDNFINLIISVFTVSGKGFLLYGFVVSLPPFNKRLARDKISKP